MSNDRRKNSRRQLHQGKVNWGDMNNYMAQQRQADDLLQREHDLNKLREIKAKIRETMPLDPPEQRNADRIEAEEIGRALITELEAKLNLPAEQVSSHEIHRIKDQCVSVLARLVRL